MILDLTLKRRHFYLLILLKARISPVEFDGLANLSGLQWPDDELEPSDFAFVLQDEQFPKYEHREYAWSLKETAPNEFVSFKPAMRLFLSSVYAYCNALEYCSCPREADFARMGLQAALELDDPVVFKAYLEFLEYIASELPEIRWYQDCFQWIAWILIRIRLSQTEDPMFYERVSFVAGIAKNFDGSISEVGVFGNDWWIETFEKLVRGSDVRASVEEIFPRKKGVQSNG